MEQVAELFKLPKKEIKNLKVGDVFTLAETETICIISDINFSKSILLNK
jgi:hypothetical protein